MFHLYVLSSDRLRDHCSCGFMDLILGFERYKKEAHDLGFEIHRIDNPNENQIYGCNVDGIFTAWCNGVNIDSDRFAGRKWKIATFIDDIHWWSKETLQTLMNVFDKVDVVFAPYYRSALKYKTYSDFTGKMQELHWWAPDYCFSIKNEPWHLRKNQILLSGAISHYYPLREIIKSSNHRCVQTLDHCGYRSPFGHPYHGCEFLDYASTFKGMIGTSAAPGKTYDGFVHNLDYTLAKTFESLGCGCLSFLEKTNDFDALGLVEDEHYIRIDPQNFCEQFERVLYRDSEKIVTNGYRLVKETHSTRNRVMSVLKSLKNKW